MSKIQEKISGGLAVKSDDKIEESSIKLDYTRIEDDKKPYTEIKIESTTNDDINNNFEDTKQIIQKKRNNKTSTKIIIAIIAFIIASGGTLVAINHNKRLKDRYKDRIETPKSTIDSDDDGNLETHTIYDDFEDTIEDFNHTDRNNDIIEDTDDRDWDPDPYNSWDPTDSGWGY